MSETLFPLPLIEDTAANRAQFRRLLAIFRQYFGETPWIDHELQAWATEQHRRLA
ncbi:MAG: hypothetical protein ACYCOU_23425 [Sulfobacillus sp.]